MVEMAGRRCDLRSVREPGFILRDHMLHEAQRADGLVLSTFLAPPRVPMNDELMELGRIQVAPQQKLSYCDNCGYEFDTSTAKLRCECGVKRAVKTKTPMEREERTDAAMESASPEVVQ